MRPVRLAQFVPLDPMVKATAKPISQKKQVCFLRVVLTSAPICGQHVCALQRKSLGLKIHFSVDITNALFSAKSNVFYVFFVMRCNEIAFLFFLVS